MSYILPHKLFIGGGDSDDSQLAKVNPIATVSHSYYQYRNDTNDRSIDSQNSDDNKAFDDVVFDVLKVDPEDIASQLTLIDLPLFKNIQPDELISCKWMSREKHIKAPNIVAFTKRFNQTAFWIQKEILQIKRLEKRAKMITHFIKISKRLHEMQNFNSLMGVIVALKSAPIYRLKKTWSLISKRDLTQFERVADVMFDTSDNKRKLREMHNNCKLPIIPFLGLYLTDLIHIDIAHPHNCFDNPQRRNQMNNICRILSDYQQSVYERLVEISYVTNYLNSFEYFEEFQKFKEDENYRDSLELEPDEQLPAASTTAPTVMTTNISPTTPLKLLTSTPINEKVLQTQIKEQQQQHLKEVDVVDAKTMNNASLNSKSAKYNSLSLSCMPQSKHRKTLSLASNSNKDFNDLLNKQQNQNEAVSKHPLDDSIIEDPTNTDTFLKIHDKSMLKELLKQRAITEYKQQGNGNTNGRNLSKNFNESINEEDHAGSGGGMDHDDCCGTGHSVATEQCTVTATTATATTTIVVKSVSTEDLAKTVLLNNERLRQKYEDNLLKSTNLTLEQKRLIVEYPTAAALLFFETPMKRKCMLKNSVKPHFSQWHSYWSQLIGNVMIYYSTKLNLLPGSGSSSGSSVMATPVVAQSQQQPPQTPSPVTAYSSSSINSDYMQECVNLERKNYHKDPCKMHPIANWMVVALFHIDDEQTTSPPRRQQQNINGSTYSSCSNSSSCSNDSAKTTCMSIKRKKYDIQLTDLNNGNMYKYRLYNYKLAKQWYYNFKLAINLHERLKPDNLIKFD